jgi:hypothetical protein
MDRPVFPAREDSAVPRHDRLISFLEREAAFVRTHIARLREQAAFPATGVTSGEGEPSRNRERLGEAEAKLKEIEAHISGLRSHQAEP